MNQIQEKKRLQLRHGIILLILSAICIFFISNWMSFYFGLYGTLMNEILLLVLSIGTVLVSGGDLRVVFPFRKPKVATLFGIIIFWLGCYGAIMIVSLIMTVLFPEQILGTGQALGDYFTSVPFIISLLIVAISPAICEEAVFRGVVMNSFSGSMGKWAAIIISGVIFGIMHGSIWRFVPTATLGIAMGYIVYETGSIFYSMLFHGINNAVPIILLYGMQSLYSAVGMEELLESTSSGGFEMPLGTAGIYLMFGGAAAFFIYIGNHLMHAGRPGYQNGLFPQEKRKALFILLGITFGCMLIGMLLFGVSLFTQQDMLKEIMNSVYS